MVDRELALRTLNIELRKALYSGEPRGDNQTCSVQSMDRFIQESNWYKVLIYGLSENESNPIDESVPLTLSMAIRPFILWAKNELSRNTNSYTKIFMSDNLMKSVVKGLAQELLHIAHRTLILELNVSRVLGELEGETPDDRFESFVRNKLNRSNLYAYYTEYPVLARILGTRTYFFVQNVIKALSRLNEDFDELRRKFNLSSTIVTELNAGLGDSHKQGSAVYQLRFSDDRKLIYKPRSLRMASIFTQILNWANKNGLKYELFHYRILDKGEYGWEEYIEQRPCSSPSDIRRYYYRLGAFLGLFHCLNGCDFHFENIIACGENPLFVDLETLFFNVPLPSEKLGISEQVKMRMLDSVRGTGLLPVRFFQSGESKGVDLSGIGGKPQLSPFPVPSIENQNTDEMKVVRKTRMMPGAQNLLMFNGRAVEIIDYIPEFIDGFSAMMHIVMNKNDEFFDVDGPLKGLNEALVRIVLRPTNQYASLLFDSFHPDFMRDAVSREKFLHTLCKARPLYGGEVTSSEIDDLIRGDIPYFATYPNSVDIINSDGRLIKSIFQNSSYDRVRTKVLKQNPQTIQREINVIRATLLCGGLVNQPVANDSNPVNYRQIEPCDIESVLKEVKSIGDHLIEQAIIDESSATWIGLCVQNGAWSYGELNPSLYDGLAGIALFLGSLGEFLQDAKYKEIARLALNRTSDTDISRSSNSLSVFYGSLSSIYAYETVKCFIGEDDRWEARKNNLIEYLKSCEISDDEIDFVAGVSGTVVLLLNLFQITNNVIFLDYAQKYADELCNRFIEVSKGSARRLRSGMGHGLSGIALSLYKISQFASNSRYKSVAKQCLELENKNFQNESMSLTWCNGAIGFGLASTYLSDVLDDGGSRKDIEPVIKQASSTRLSNDSLCHGNMGIAEFLLAYGVKFHRNDLVEMARSVVRVVIDNRECEGNYRCGVPNGVESLGLMPGLAGIGYQMLRCCFPDRFPSVLLFEYPKVRTSVKN
ncbi:type 2 lanthipeptide synthetase LanM family protein [Alicyclobacillus acidiphilus]|uniref:type 2 lanthipeptide synthetase LanM family protein n=1 Tax=Alicyclobacillus acidiphilus TaxID=182455 RepID=UPI000AC9F470|nr:type 2 lanthipeptide synthetase LanM family protein [Alicyclobacillus acidiphilus]